MTHGTTNVTKSQLKSTEIFCLYDGHPNHLVLAGTNNRNVIITYRFLATPVQANRDFFLVYRLYISTVSTIKVPPQDFAFWAKPLRGQ